MVVWKKGELPLGVSLIDWQISTRMGAFSMLDEIERPDRQDVGK